MALWNFTLVLSGVRSSTPKLEDALFTAGCDDALICFYGTAVYLEFDREAVTLNAAVSGAIGDIEGAGIGARVESVDSTLVGLSDIAELANLSRQAIALLKDGTRGNGDFPNPIHRITGQSPLWSWAEVAEWLVASGRMSADNPLVRNARELDQWNLALRVRASKASEKVDERVQFLTHMHTGETCIM
ncbi:helix-turn-helix transcriptional regulator [Erwinia psidii]|uniref:DNA-binding protein n=1 Tax=Erwinia psidii TaxID=69224 RepID=A0A3N6SF08_9GAMM|nr:DNA-binding protein [Erwinia psidii]MCX8957860.1 DNA-binding protein [Erwinia psidii]MCX8960911.1 DNA-binding protein [Erwinia psidii]MCX8964849.1 DNA-binding protein [Erwinia psidii]RQM38473.1 DNA-binding protein [Erwinia psidii]